MAHDRVVHVTVAQGEVGNRADIDIVRLPIAGAVIGKFGMGDCDGAGAGHIWRGQQPFLHAVKIAVGNKHVAGLIANARHIAIRRAVAAAGEGEALNLQVCIDRDQAFIVWRRLIGHLIDHPAHRQDRDAGVYGAEIIHIRAGLHQDRIAVHRSIQRRRLANSNPCPTVSTVPVAGFSNTAGATRAEAIRAEAALSGAGAAFMTAPATSAVCVSDAVILQSQGVARHVITLVYAQEPRAWPVSRRSGIQGE